MKSEKKIIALNSKATPVSLEKIDTGKNKAKISISRGLLNQFLLGITLLLVVGIGLYLIFSTDMVFRSSLLEQHKIELEVEIDALIEENHVLRQKLERLKTDPDYVEDQARKKLGLIRPGEIIYRLSEEPDLGPSSPPPPVKLQ